MKIRELRMLGIGMFFLAVALISCGDGGGGSSSGGGPSPPIVATGYNGQIYRGLSETTGIGYGNVTSDGGAPPVFERGICWGTTPDPSKETARCRSTSAGTGGFSEQLDIIPGAIYHMRAYAINSLGTGWGRSAQITLGIRY